MPETINRINLRTMRSAVVVSQYSATNALQAHERAALDHVAAEFRGAAILDIGVGGGRTVQALLAVSPDYLGIDYSPEMVAACRARFPEQRFEQADARELTDVGDDSIGLAVFSCNGISMTGHQDRLRIMREVLRVLRPGGAFLFTTYNLGSPEATAGFRLPVFRPSWNPIRLALRSLHWMKKSMESAANRWHHRRLEVRTTQWAMVNDFCHNYGVMLYYVTLEEQRRQLREVGFRPDALAFDLDGRPLGETSVLDSIAFIARKP